MGSFPCETTLAPQQHHASQNSEIVCRSIPEIINVFYSIPNRHSNFSCRSGRTNTNTQGARQVQNPTNIHRQTSVPPQPQILPLSRYQTAPQGHSGIYRLADQKSGSPSNLQSRQRGPGLQNGPQVTPGSRGEEIPGLGQPSREDNPRLRATNGIALKVDS